MERNTNIALFKIELEYTDPVRCTVDMIFPYTALHYIVSGSGYFNGVKLHAGDFFCCEQNCHSCYYPAQNDPWVYYWCNISGNNHREILSSHGINPEKPYGHFPCINEVASIQKMFDNYQKKYEDNVEFRQTLAWMLFSLHNTQGGQPENNNSSYQRCIDIKNYIDTNYYHIFSIEEISQKFFISRMYLRNQFMQYFHISPKQYLQKVRMENAARYLKGTDYTISLIASSIGYTNICVFSKAFKNYYGVSPNEYRKGKNDAANESK